MSLESAASSAVGVGGNAATNVSKGAKVLAPESDQSASSTPESGVSSLAPKMTSMRVFREFMKRIPDPADPKRMIVDASGIVSKACYEMWCSTRNLPFTDDYRAAKTFQRALTGHLSATDGRLPFSPEEEEAVLQVVRIKRVWPCFIGTSHVIGAKGFRSKGFHERQIFGENPLGSVMPNVDNAVGHVNRPAAKKRGKKQKIAEADLSSAQYTSFSPSSLGATSALLMSLSRPQYQLIPPLLDFGAFPSWMMSTGTQGVNPLSTSMPSSAQGANAQVPTGLDQSLFPR